MLFGCHCFFLFFCVGHSWLNKYLLCLTMWTLPFLNLFKRSHENISLLFCLSNRERIITWVFFDLQVVEICWLRLFLTINILTWSVILSSTEVDLWNKVLHWVYKEQGYPNEFIDVLSHSTYCFNVLNWMFRLFHMILFSPFLHSVVCIKIHIKPQNWITRVIWYWVLGSPM